MSFFAEIQDRTKAALDKKAREEQEALNAYRREREQRIAAAKEQILPTVEEIKSLMREAADRGERKISYLIANSYPDYNAPEHVLAEGVVRILRSEGFNLTQTYHWRVNHSGGISDDPRTEEEFGVKVEWV